MTDFDRVQALCIAHPARFWPAWWWPENKITLFIPFVISLGFVLVADFV